jgi:hypothetical protein
VVLSGYTRGLYIFQHCFKLWLFIMDPVQYLPEYQVLICKSCRHALQPDHIATHFRSKEHRMSREESRRMAAACRQWPLLDSYTQPIMPTSVVHPIDHLPIFRDGLACQHCRYVCRSKEVMKRHQRRDHGLKSGRRRPMTRSWTSTFKSSNDL